MRQTDPAYRLRHIPYTCPAIDRAIRAAQDGQPSDAESYMEDVRAMNTDLREVAQEILALKELGDEQYEELDREYQDTKAELDRMYGEYEPGNSIVLTVVFPDGKGLEQLLREFIRSDALGAALMQFTNGPVPVPDDWMVRRFETQVPAGA